MEAVESQSELLDTFRIVDEDKDSDEESIHLFLESDSEVNKSDDKLTGTEETQAPEENSGKENKSVKCDNGEIEIDSSEKIPDINTVAKDATNEDLANLKENNKNHSEGKTKLETETEEDILNKFVSSPLRPETAAENLDEDQLLDDIFEDPKTVEQKEGVEANGVDAAKETLEEDKPNEIDTLLAIEDTGTKHVKESLEPKNVEIATHTSDTVVEDSTKKDLEKETNPSVEKIDSLSNLAKPIEEEVGARSEDDSNKEPTESCEEVEDVQMETSDDQAIEKCQEKFDEKIEEESKDQPSEEELKDNVSKKPDKEPNDHCKQKSTEGPSECRDSEQLDNADLFDISMIKDSAEDDAELIEELAKDKKEQEDHTSNVDKNEDKSDSGDEVSSTKSGTTEQASDEKEENDLEADSDAGVNKDNNCESEDDKPSEIHSEDAEDSTRDSNTTSEVEKPTDEVRTEESVFGESDSKDSDFYSKDTGDETRNLEDNNVEENIADNLNENRKTTDEPLTTPNQETMEAAGMEVDSDFPEITSKPTKRTLSEDLENDSTSKKPRLSVENEISEKTVSADNEVHTPSENDISNGEKDISQCENHISTGEKDITKNVTEKNNTDLSVLLSFSSYMKKFSLKRLTRKDMEEFCMQKMCEAILHRSKLGEMNEQVKMMENIIENYRKDQLSLTKQIKDLEIVNKKLMHEVKNNAIDKPLVPVKITRSVGLQVRLPLQGQQPSPVVNNMNVKRKASMVTPQRTVNRTTKVIASVNNNNNVRRQVIAASPKKPMSTLQTKSPVKTLSPVKPPLLTQALQGRPRPLIAKPSPKASPKASPKTGPAANANKAKAKNAKPGGSFIDLTDEDDKSAKSSVTPLPTTIRLATGTPKSPVVVATSGSATPQVMYVVQSNSHLTGQGMLAANGTQKAMLVNFQPNGAIGSAINSSGVSVLTKGPNTVQLKTVTSPIIKTAKHPAPLPNAPVVVVPKKSTKLVPPKPHLTIRKTGNGIILQWRMPYDLNLYEEIASYQLYAYQETASVPSTDMWRKIGDVKAMALPMACTLTQFADKNKYYFAVRPVDIHERIGKFSNPEEISL